MKEEKEVYKIILMAGKYRIKYQKLIERLRQARLEAGLTQVETGKNSKSRKRVFPR